MKEKTQNNCFLRLWMPKLLTIFICYLPFRKKKNPVEAVWDGELESGHENSVRWVEYQDLTCQQPLVGAPGTIRAGLIRV